jgi:trk system potassium uptake protein TrkA
MSWMRIVIAGSGRVGGDLAHELADHGHDVSVVDYSKKALEELGTTFNGSVHLGLAYDVGVLKEAGIEYADAFVAVTDSDNANLMAVQLAKEVFMVPKTIARLDDPNRERAYRELDVAYIPASKLIAKVVYEQVVEEEFRFHVTFEDGETEIVDMRLGAAAENLQVADLEIDNRLRVAAVRREGKTYIPDHEFHLKEGDLVVAAARKGVVNKIRRYLVTEQGT